MNFLDTYDITTSRTPPPNEVNLNEEVNQVLGQLSDFWSWGKKQSQAAFETARKDLTEVVSQAQKEVTKLTESATAPNEPATSDQNDDTEDDREIAPKSTSSTAQTLFSRLQSALPPNVVSTVQQNIPDSLKHAGDNIDFAQLRTTLSNEFQRVQGITRTQAEDYIHKSESLLREVVKEAGDALSNAVKVIPPDETSPTANAGLLWDGTDMWMLPDPPETIADSSGKGKGKASVQHAVATRAEALLKRLKHEPDILRHNLEADEGVKASYIEWLAAEVTVEESGMSATKWATKIKANANDTQDGQALQATLNTLVPSEMDEETFWRRYFFRVHQIEQEEAKRKALIQDSITVEEDFSWDDEEEEAPSSAVKARVSPALKTKSSTNTIQPPEKGEESRREPSTDNTSPRESSEESYDLVSRDGDKKKTDEDDGDSDWE